MPLKRLAIPFLTISATAPLAMHLAKGGEGEKTFSQSRIASDTESSGMNQYSWRSYWLEKCKPFSISEETIFVCPEIWEDQGPSFYYYKIEYKGDKKDNAFSLHAQQVKEISYKYQTNVVEAGLLDGEKILIKEFPEEFKKLEKDWVIEPNKSCKIDGNSLGGKTKKLSCKFLKVGEYTYISLAE
ncbi:hypothetical protein DNK47_01450 [Mycoplasma wenyonii]|uniref:Uncharacterized protein n=1 Tax=Mycoplasma wenyonii TaxID=65123 RepID=A0A328PS41_9MOLU|nr:hypothetical protein [Mycoplasma wenyonii]RAO95137.1 hypothetical protein DNK47_01450 [Mycoplasma wenyonii]